MKENGSRHDSIRRTGRERTGRQMEEKKEDLKFEEAFELLRREAEIISSDSVSLEEAMESYKKGKEYFEICSRKLQEAKQLIQIYDKENDTIKEM